MAAFARRGLKVAPFKVGPDFIDPGHHSLIAGCTSRNLDGWMLDRAYNRSLFNRHAGQADMAVIEGVMGLYDGFSGRSEAGSSAQMAKWLGVPVLLAVDARSMARSAAALVMGFERFDPRIAFAGVVFNRVGSPRHLAYLKEALTGHVKMPCLGGLPRQPQIRIPERHLGLVTYEDHHLDAASRNLLAEWVETGMDIDRLIRDLPDLHPDAVGKPRSATAQSMGGPRIGVARDKAFCFYYADNLDLLEAAGARLVYFSPLHDTALPQDLDGLYLGGGYPELKAATLSQNENLRRQIAAGSRAGMPIYAECGGFMYLCRQLEDTTGRSYPMCGCFPMDSRMLGRLKSLGYREVTLRQNGLLGTSGTVIRGHEFHYSDISAPPARIERLYQVSDRSGIRQVQEGFVTGRTLGSYYHLHFGSCPRAAQSFVNHCRQYSQERSLGS